MIAACFRCPEHEASADSRRHFRQYSRTVRRLRCAATFQRQIGLADLFSVDGQHAQLAGYGPGELFGAYPEPVTHRADISAGRACRCWRSKRASIAALASATRRHRARALPSDGAAARHGARPHGGTYRLERNWPLLSRAARAKAAEDWITPLPVLSALAIGVNTTRETASRALAHLVRRGIVERHDHGLKIVSRRMLEDLVVV